MIKNFLLCFLLLLFSSAKLFSQQISLQEFIGLKDMSLKEIDDALKTKKFTRFDTTVSGLNFRFYAFAQRTNSAYQLNYIQITIKENYNYPQLQFQTSIQKEADAWQQQLVAKGFLKIANESDEVKITSYKKNNMVIDYFEEAENNGTLILYTFKLHDNKNYNPELFKKS